MKSFTGYYNKIKEYQKDNLYTVSISRSKPRHIKVDYTEPALAPTKELLHEYKHNDMNFTKYISSYVFNILSTGIDVSAIIAKIIRKARKEKKAGVVFMCYENPDVFCHRFILSNLTKQYIPEYGREYTFGTRNSSWFSRTYKEAYIRHTLSIQNANKQKKTDDKNIDIYPTVTYRQISDINEVESLYLILGVSSDGKDMLVKHLDKKYKGLQKIYASMCKYGITYRKEGRLKAKAVKWVENRQISFGNFSPIRADIGMSRYIVFIPTDNGKNISLTNYLTALRFTLDNVRDGLYTSMSIIIPDKYNSLKDRNKIMRLLKTTPIASIELLTLIKGEEND